MLLSIFMAGFCLVIIANGVRLMLYAPAMQRQTEHGLQFGWQRKWQPNLLTRWQLRFVRSQLFVPMVRVGGGMSVLVGLALLVPVALGDVRFFPPASRTVTLLGGTSDVTPADKPKTP